MALKFTPRADIKVSGGWIGPIAEIVEILSKPAADGSRKARPVALYIMRAVRKDKAFIAALARGDAPAAALALRKVAEKIMRPGVKPQNKPWALRVKGNRKALRNVRGRDRIFRTFRTWPPTPLSKA